MIWVIISAIFGLTSPLLPLCNLRMWYWPLLVHFAVAYCQFHMDSDFFLLLQTRWSLLFLPAVNLALGPVSVSPVKMWDPGLWALQSHADQGCSMHVMFSPGSCVWVRHVAGQFDKQRWCVLNQRLWAVFMLPGAFSSMPCVISLLSLAQSIDIITVCNFFFVCLFYLQKCVRFRQ